MNRVRTLLIVIALAATACSSDTDTAAEVESPTTTVASAALISEPASEPVADGTINIETEVDFEREPSAGTFVVDQGANVLGCDSGSMVEAELANRITNTFTCEDGDRAGTFTLAWKIVEGSEGPGDFNGPWSVLEATGDFAGLTGEGLWSGVAEGETGFGSFPGVIEFGAEAAATSEADPVLIADVVAYSEAFGAGDFDLAWSMVSARCHDIVPVDDYRGAVEFFAVEAPDLTAFDITAVVDGDRAAVSYSISMDGLEYVAQQWALADGSWHWDDC